MCRMLNLDEYDGNFDLSDVDSFDTLLEETTRRNVEQQRVDDNNWLYDLDDLYN